MAITASQPIIQGIDVPDTTIAAIYTAGAGVVRTRIDAISFTNYSASPATLDVQLVESGGATGNTKYLIKGKILAANETFTPASVIGQAVESAGILAALSSVATAIAVTATGTEFTS